MGGYLNKFLPSWITTILLTVMLFLMAARLFTKGRQTYDIETKLICKLHARSKSATAPAAAIAAAAAAVQAGSSTENALTQPLLANGEEAADDSAARDAADGEQQQVLAVTLQPQPVESAPLPVPRALQTLRAAAAARAHGGGSPGPASPAVFEGSSPSPRVGSGFFARGTPTGSRRRFGRLHSITKHENKSSYTRVEAMHLFQVRGIQLRKYLVEQSPELDAFLATVCSIVWLFVT